MKKRVLSIDIGASSGRGIIGEFDGERIEMAEIHRFANEPVTVCGHIYWDILRLFHEVKQAIKKAGDIDSIGIDTWGVDFGLIDKNGNLLGNPYHYRDIRNEKAHKLNVYSQTGIQFMGFNTLYQLQKTDLSFADKILLIPDLLAYFLTGNMRMEYTNSSTTNLLCAKTHELSQEVLELINVPRSMFADMIKPHEVYGSLRDDICNELGVKSVPVIAVGTHDTASAVASIPDAGDDFVYISSGTWSLLGTLSDSPIVNESSEKMNFTNELGVDFRTRLLKNIMGLWLIQEIRREYDTDFLTLSQAAQSEKPFSHIIDPDMPLFLGMGDMKGRIMRAVNEKLTMAQTARCIYDSLALKYRYTVCNLQKITGKKYNKMYMFGGGIKDSFLCQSTADACGIPVIACSDEATALGNIAVQVTDDIAGVMEKSINKTVYVPQNTQAYDAAFEKALHIFEGE